jgi:hypothetical protein
VNPIEAAEDVAQDVARWFHHDKESTVTETTQAPASADAPSIPYWPAVHQNLAVFASRVESFLPKLARLADAVVTAPVVDDVVEAALLAAGMGVAEEVFAGVVALLKARPEDAEGAAFDLLKTVMHQSPAAPAGPAGAQEPAAPAQATFTPAVRVGAPAQPKTPSVI